MPRNRWKKPRPLFSSSVPPEVKKPKIKWKAFPIIWLSLKRGAMLIGFLVMFSSLMSAILLGAAAGGAGPKPLPKEMVLVLNFEGALREVPPKASFSDPFVDEDLTVRQLVDTIIRARDDDRVKGIVARMRDGNFSLAHIQELRSAIAKFKESGKFTKIYSSSFAGAGTGLGRYYLASSFDELWMQPMGILTISGMNAQMPFFRNVMDKLGVKPEFFKRKKYKTAYENITDNEMSAPNREMMVALINDFRDGLVMDISADRNIDAAAFNALVDKGLFTADEALDAKLIDFNDYADVMVDGIRKQVTGNVDDKNLGFVTAERYHTAVKNEKAPAGGAEKNKPKVALVYAAGAIMAGSSEAKAPAVAFGQQVAAARVIAPAILDAVEDDDVETIVLRVDSPGGSPTASEAILRALEKAKEKKKNVLVSMGPTAASGGYWIAANADKIFVLPMTITGSIGVVGGKFSTKELWNKLGVNWDGFSWGENAGMWSVNEPFSESEAERINAMLDHVYKNFLERVAVGRGMSVEQVDRLAQGRVWSGKSALQNGLADMEGGLRETLEYAAQLSGKSSLDEINVVQFPKPKTPIEQFLELLNGQVHAGAAQYALGRGISEMLAPAYTQFDMIQSPEEYMTYDSVMIR